MMNCVINGMVDNFFLKRHFWQFSIASPKKFQMAVNRTILILEPLPMSHLKAYLPNFPNYMRKRSQSLKYWVLDLSKVRWSENLAAQKRCFFGIFWEEVLSHGQTVYFWPHCVLHIRKAEHLRINKIRLKFDFRHHVKRQICGTSLQLFFPLYWKAVTYDLDLM